LSRTIGAWVAPLRELVAQRHGIDHVAPLGQRDHGAEQDPVRLPVEHGVVQDFRGLQGRILIEQHRA
jgi:hypothetical protein